jgi:two-component system KDP operon response regulator KdpE
MIGKKVLIVDDDTDLQRLIAKIFQNAGASVEVAVNGTDGIRKFFLEKPDLVILDIMMPELDGFEVCRRIRQVSSVPVIMLTALNSDSEIIRGLESGSDDFVSKPFSSEVLIARSKAILRRLELPQDTKPRLLYRDDYLTIDLEKRLVEVRGEPIKLTRTEYNLLAYLVQNAGWIRTFDQILETVWGHEYQGSMDYIHVYISNLRRKIEVDSNLPQYLESEHGVGYRFNKKKS